MENHFYHIKWPPLNVTIFITHMQNLSNGCYAKEMHLSYFVDHLDHIVTISIKLLWILAIGIRVDV